MINIDNDSSLLETGQWAEFDGSKFLVAHMSNLDFQREVQRLQVPYRRRIEQNTLDPKVSRDIMCKAMSSKLIMDWDNVVDKTGNKIPFSKEACYKALVNNEDLRDFISSFAMTIDNFKQTDKEDLVKS